MKYYKILKRTGEKLFSAGDIHKSLIMEYQEGVINKSIVPGGKLFCFATRKHARAFKKSRAYRGAHEIWEIEVENVQPISFAFRAWSEYSFPFNEYFNRAKSFWETGDTSFGGTVNPHSFATESVKLIRKIH